ncbi:branched-chain amino acid aminotransferase [Salinicoccus sp. ID82-1]|uniref:Branched-chain-amino-acid aminotransferase n=1 Tax=Salinicoccus cyprini TaxID=2493691 RepID=A0A558ASV8_9STAP|nr:MULTISPECIES: branched-chain amino acid aminotransferase [Salinicoccus]MCG1009792.1 branched-chain amino acid aminotransferase [Salinicoccus sp. ID82-1]TVT27340.1 branched-chain amino acid aminotransferase [Salinicoccus cyprini]
MGQTLQIERANQLKNKPDVSTIKFGTVFTDYMFTSRYTPEYGWSEHSIIPYQNLQLSPSCQAIHYGQSVFEGLKAYKNGDDVLVFRPDQNFKRMNQSLSRLSMPEINEENALDALLELLKVERDWVPDGEGQSLYIRPFVFADEPFLGVRPSESYQFNIILSPVASYYGNQLNPSSLYVEDDFVRSVRGGVGFAKASGNYAASLLAQKKANELGYEQVLWLDGVEQKYVEEVGSMNIFFVRDNELVTPKLNGSILPGITRKSLIELAEYKGYTVKEESIHIDDLANDLHSGRITEVFGAGTAAVISPVGRLNIHGVDHIVNDNQIGPVSQDLYDHFTDIQYGRREDPFGWVVKL